MAWKLARRGSAARRGQLSRMSARRQFTAKNQSKNRAAGLKRAAARRGTRRPAKPLVLTRPLARAVDLHNKRGVIAHHSEMIGLVQKLVPEGEINHGIFLCTPHVYQVGQVVTAGVLQPDTVSSREGSAVRIRSWKIQVKIMQNQLLAVQVDPNNVGGFASACYDKYDFNIWVAYNKVATNTTDAMTKWQPTIGPPAHPGYKTNAWRIMSGLKGTNMPLNDAMVAAMLTPNTTQMTVLRSKKFSFKAGGYTYSGTGAAPTHAAAALNNSPRGFCRTFHFSIKANTLLKYATPQDWLPAIAPLVYIQYRRHDDGPAALIFQAQVSARLVFDDAA